MKDYPLKSAAPDFLMLRDKQLYCIATPGGEYSFPESKITVTDLSFLDNKETNEFDDKNLTKSYLTDIPSTIQVNATDFSISPDGKYYAITSWKSYTEGKTVSDKDHFIEIYEVQTGKKVFSSIVKKEMKLSNQSICWVSDKQLIFYSETPSSKNPEDSSLATYKPLYILTLT